MTMRALFNQRSTMFLPTAACECPSLAGETLIFVADDDEVIAHDWNGRPLNFFFTHRE
jgi:hypothetical protein